MNLPYPPLPLSPESCPLASRRQIESQFSLGTPIPNSRLEHTRFGDSFDRDWVRTMNMLRCATESAYRRILHRARSTRFYKCMSSEMVIYNNMICLPWVLGDPPLKGAE